MDDTARAEPIADPLTMVPALGYLLDSWQRSILYLDVLRQRGNQYHEHMAEAAPNVLNFAAEPVMDGRRLDRPVNYLLVRITPPAGVEVSEGRRPFIVVDPRAGHGPGIGGFKADSEIGVALAAGHPCYFIGFLPHPEPGQTVEDVMRAEARFVEKVAELHPGSVGRPVVIGNCQAGWQVMMAAATRPELFGPIIVAGAPLSYWNGVHGVNPLRYTGGLLGGSWLTALTGDLGRGIFDGAWLVQNFESMNPANTLWSKQRNLYAKVDTEAQRYLGFERWWGGHVLLAAEEMQFIVDSLFVGNKLATAELATSDGTRIDLRNVRGPIIVFCSKGDDITPPQQALGWITDLYASVDDIRAYGQTIVYAVHERIGHLGIFVSAGVARKEHDEFASNIDLIDVLPPGLYEAVITARDAADPNVELVGGAYVLSFEARDLDDLRTLGGNDEADERRFAAVARLSEINLGLYRTFVQPWVRATVSEPMAEMARQMHPLRLGFTLFSDKNPFLRDLPGLADRVRERRRPAGAGNAFVQAEQAVSGQIESALKAYAAARDSFQEQVFLAAYGSPWLQAMLGLRASDAPPRRRPGEEPEQRAFVAEQTAALVRRIGNGSLREAMVRAVTYVLLADRRADERTFNLLRQMRREQGEDLDLTAFKALWREQFLMLLLDPQGALTALPHMVEGGSTDEIERARSDLRRLCESGGALSDEARARLTAVDAIFGEAASRSSTGGSAGAATAAAADVAAQAPALPGARPGELRVIEGQRRQA